MSRELNFDGWWEGDAVYSCDCPGCHNEASYRFDSEDVDSKSHRTDLRTKGWITTQVEGKWKDFCSEKCRNKYIRTKTK